MGDMGKCANISGAIGESGDVWIGELRGMVPKTAKSTTKDSKYTENVS